MAKGGFMRLVNRWLKDLTNGRAAVVAREFKSDGLDCFEYFYEEAFEDPVHGLLSGGICIGSKRSLWRLIPDRSPEDVEDWRAACANNVWNSSNWRKNSRRRR